MNEEVTLASILARLLERGVLAGDVREPGGVTVRGVRTDSRRIRPGELFCATRGMAADGHLFLADAAERGSVAALVEKADPDVSLPQYRVRNGRLAAAHAAAAFHADPWQELTLVGVTGTNGKTTVAAILRHLLGPGGEPAASLGTLGLIAPDGSVCPGTEGLTTPGPVEVAAWLRHVVENGVGALAMEVSSHALDQQRVAAVRFDAAVFTNLSRDHLDYHGTLDGYRVAKLRLAGLLKPGGVAVVNADDPAWRELAVPDGCRLLRFGSVADAEVRTEVVSGDDAGTVLDLHLGAERRRLRLPLLGAFNAANAMAAAAAAWGLGVSEDEIAAALATLPQVSGRLERVPGPAGAPTVVIDFAHTPAALAGALAALRPLASGRLIVVFGAGGDRDRGKRPEMGRVVAEHADLAIVTSDNSRSEAPERIADEIEAGMDALPRLRILDRREAIERALHEASREDLVLLAGKGHERYQLQGAERRPFDEREIVRACWRGGGA